MAGSVVRCGCCAAPNGKACPAGRVNTHSLARRKPEPIGAVERPDSGGTDEIPLARDGASSTARHGEHPVSPRRGHPRQQAGAECAAPDPDPVLVREMVADRDYGRDRVRVFEVHLRAESVIRIDNREIVEARFVDPRVLLAADDLPPFIRACLGDVRPCGNGRSTGA